jgi:hypothetical protein
VFLVNIIYMRDMLVLIILYLIIAPQIYYSVFIWPEGTSGASFRVAL